MDQKKQPHILLITTDQQRFDTCGAKAPPFMRTPHFDFLSNSGITFTSAYATCPLSVPSRVSIMTGKEAHTHGIYGNPETSRFLGNCETLPYYLKGLGYQSVAIGKMHFGPERARHGFEEMIIPSDYYREMAKKGGAIQPMRHGVGQNELYPTMATVPEAETLTSWISEKCVEFIKERRDPTAPFFLWCSYSKPHPPLDPPEPYYSMYREAPIPEPAIGNWSEGESCPVFFQRFREGWSLDKISPQIIREGRAAYYGLITQIDYNMGRVFSALQDEDLLKETLIIYTSDHGELLGDHHSGAKMFFYEGSSHIPMVMRLPEGRGEEDEELRGTVVETAVTLSDILPTLVKAAGGEAPANCDGIDLYRVSKGDNSPKERRIVEASCFFGPEEAPYFGLTDGQWKYIYYPEGGQEQLFNLKEDPYELNDLVLSGSQEGVLEEFREELITRHYKRGVATTDGKKLFSRPVEKDTTRERRAKMSWPGFHTENYREDVRH